MSVRSPGHTVAILATVAALSVLVVPAFIVPPTTTVGAGVEAVANVAGPDQIDPEKDPPPLPLTCVIEPLRTEYVVGDVPSISVRLKNESEKSLVLVGSLDASDLRWRYPYCYYDIQGPPKAEPHGMPRCGMTNPMRAKDFVTVEPGKEFDPNASIDDYGFFATNFNWRSFSVPGTYKLTYVYSTASHDPGHWVGDGKSDELRKLFDQVPKGRVRSNTIEIEFAPSPEGYVPHTNIPANHPDAQNHGAWFIFKFMANGPIKPPHQRMVLLFDGMPDGLTGERVSLEFANMYGDLYSEVSPLINAGHEMTRPTTLVAFDPDLKILADAPLDDFASMENHFKALPTKAVSRETVLQSIADVASNEDYQEESVVVLVFTEHVFDDKDVPEIRGAGDEKQNISVVRVTRRNGSWVPQRVTGK